MNNELKKVTEIIDNEFMREEEKEEFTFIYQVAALVLAFYLAATAWYFLYG